MFFLGFSHFRRFRARRVVRDVIIGMIYRIIQLGAVYKQFKNCYKYLQIMCYNNFDKRRFRSFLKTTEKNMTIKKRLAVSNTIMIIIPVLIAAMVGVICVVGVYFVLHYTDGFGFDSNNDFYRVSESIASAADEAFEGKDKSIIDKLTVLSGTLDKKNIGLTVEKNGAPFYSFGGNSKGFESLFEASEKVAHDTFISNENKQIFHHNIKNGADSYSLWVTSTNKNGENTALKVAIGISAGLIIAAVVLSVILTNRFLIRFVFRKVEQPLDMLRAGVKEISEGNLDYRIDYYENDEFLPVSNAFNDMAQRLKESVELTKRNEESRKELLLDISHDLRSPLTAIQAYVEGLLDGVATDEQMRLKYLRTIKRKTEDIENMVSEIFSYSKLDMGEAEISLERLNLNEEMRRITEALGDEYKQKGLEITLSGYDTYSLSDSRLLCRISTNLFENTLKYSQRENCTILINVYRENNKNYITFSDNGVGVAAEETDKMFTVFYRGDKARSNPGNGNGIGLAFVQKAVQAMNGSVSAQNENGLKIIIELPCEE